jgi:hypothetical protein
MKVNKTSMLFVERKDGTYDVVSGLAFCWADSGIYLTVEGNRAVMPPHAKMTGEQMTDWIKALKAAGFQVTTQDRLGKPQTLGT